MAIMWIIILHFLQMKIEQQELAAADMEEIVA